VGDTAVEHMVESTTAMPAHDDALSPTRVRHAYVRVRQGPGRDFHLPRAIEAIAHEVTEVRQGLLIVILEHHSGPWWASYTTAPQRRQTPLFRYAVAARAGGALWRDARPLPHGHSVRPARLAQNSRWGRVHV